MTVTPVRAAGDLMPLVQADYHILLVADGLRAGGTHYAPIAKPGSAATLVTSDNMLTPGFEPIAATQRWPGSAHNPQPLAPPLSAISGHCDFLLKLRLHQVQLATGEH